MSRRYGIPERKTANAVRKKRQRELGPSPLLRSSNVEMRPPFCALEGSDVFQEHAITFTLLKTTTSHLYLYLTFHSASYYMTHTVVKVQRR